MLTLVGQLAALAEALLVVYELRRLASELRVLSRRVTELERAQRTPLGLSRPPG